MGQKLHILENGHSFSSGTSSFGSIGQNSTEAATTTNRTSTTADTLDRFRRKNQHQSKIVINRHSVSYQTSANEFKKVGSFQADTRRFRSSVENTYFEEDTQNKIHTPMTQMAKVSPHPPQNQNLINIQQCPGSDISLWSNQDVTLELNGKKLAKISLPGSCEVKLTQDEGFMTAQSKPQLFIKTLPLTNKYCLTTWCVGSNRKRYQILCRVQYCPILQCAYVSGKMPFDLVHRNERGSQGGNVFELRLTRKITNGDKYFLRQAWKGILYYGNSYGTMCPAYDAHILRQDKF